MKKAAKNNVAFFVNRYNLLVIMNAEEKVKSIIGNRVDVSKLNKKDKLNEIGLDSLDLLEVMLEIEESLNIEIKSDEVLNLVTIDDLLKLIQGKTK